MIEMTVDDAYREAQDNFLVACESEDKNPSTLRDKMIEAINIKKDLTTDQDEKTNLENTVKVLEIIQNQASDPNYYKNNDDHTYIPLRMSSDSEELTTQRLIDLAFADLTSGSNIDQDRLMALREDIYPTSYIDTRGVKILNRRGQESMLAYLHMDPAVQSLVIDQEGNYIFTRRAAPAKGEGENTIVSISTRVSNGDASESAMNALREVYQGDEGEVQMEEDNIQAYWKYCDVEVSGRVITVLSADNFNVTDEAKKNRGVTEIVSFSFEEFKSAVERGEISDVSTIAAVYRHEVMKQIDPKYFGSKYQVHEDLSEPLVYAGGTREVYDKVDFTGTGTEWLPQGVGAKQEEIVTSRGDQAMLLVVEGNKVHFTSEPTFSQGKRAVYIASGEVERHTTPEATARKEFVEETGHAIPDEVHLVKLVTGDLHARYFEPHVHVYVAEAETQKGNKDGADEADAEKSGKFSVDVNQLPWMIANGMITDASVVAGVSKYILDNAEAFN